jgi:hypothetical protein
MKKTNLERQTAKDVAVHGEVTKTMVAASEVKKEKKRFSLFCEKQIGNGKSYLHGSDKNNEFIFRFFGKRKKKKTSLLKKS